MMKDKLNNINSYQKCVKFYEGIFKYLPKLSLPYGYVISLSKNYDNADMWARYTDKYKGACLEFKLDNSKILMEQGFSNLYQVNYANSPTVNLFDYLNFTNNNVRYLFKNTFNKLLDKGLINYKKRWVRFCKNSILTKDPSWKSEKEYRLIHFNLTNEPFKVTYKFSDLVSIILGNHINLSNQMKILKILQLNCKKYSIKTFPVYSIKRTNKGMKRSLIFIIKNGELRHIRI